MEISISASVCVQSAAFCSVSWQAVYLSPVFNYLLYFLITITLLPVTFPLVDVN